MIVLGMLACRPQPLDHSGEEIDEQEAAAAARLVYESAEQSVHELITCGGVQSELALTLVIGVVSSADGLISDEARDDIDAMLELFGMSLDIPVERNGVSWPIPMSGAATGTFDVIFRDPQTGEPLPYDLFSLETYVTGAVGTSSRTWEEMIEDPTVTDTFTFDWQERGPLSHLLEPLTNPIVVQASLFDLAMLALSWGDDSEMDLGSFDGLGEVQMDGQILFEDDQSGVMVRYDASIDASVRAFATGSPAEIGVNSVRASYEGFGIETKEVALSYVPGGLAGQIVYEIEREGEAYEVTSDFGEGALYSEATWRCLEGC